MLRDDTTNGCVVDYPGARGFSQINVSGKLPIYPSLKPTLTLISYLGKNVAFGEG